MFGHILSTMSIPRRKPSFLVQDESPYFEMLVEDVHRIICSHLELPVRAALARTCKQMMSSAAGDVLRIPTQWRNKLNKTTLRGEYIRPLIHIPFIKWVMEKNILRRLGPSVKVATMSFKLDLYTTNVVRPYYIFKCSKFNKEVDEATIFVHPDRPDRTDNDEDINDFIEHCHVVQIMANELSKRRATVPADIRASHQAELQTYKTALVEAKQRYTTLKKLLDETSMRDLLDFYGGGQLYVVSKITKLSETANNIVSITANMRRIQEVIDGKTRVPQTNQEVVILDDDDEEEEEEEETRPAKKQRIF